MTPANEIQLYRLEIDLAYPGYISSVTYNEFSPTDFRHVNLKMHNFRQMGFYNLSQNWISKTSRKS